MNTTPIDVQLGLLGLTYALYNNRPDYEQHRLIQDNLDDFKIVSDLWHTDENSTDPIISQLFVRVLNQHGLVDNGEIDWLTNYFGTNADLDID